MHAKRKLTPTEKDAFVIEKYISDIRQGQKIAADLLESIMKTTRLVKEGFRRI